MTLFEQILRARGLVGAAKRAFLFPKYETGHDPFLLPDMDKAVHRLVEARARQDMIVIYGDYDIDGLTATAVLREAFDAFGFEKVDTFIPNRFVEGYGMTVDAVERIAKMGATLIVTVDCGSLSEEPIRRAGALGIDVIVTDHHNVAPVQPPAVAVINPKRLLQDYPDAYRGYRLMHPAPASPLYPFLDLPGVGVAFKLVQALQTRLEGLPAGQEKWLLDLVALGTVCDVVTLVDENRMHVYWGLKVLAKTRRPGLKALMAVAGVTPESVDARSLGFALGPRMNAAGRLETAQYAHDMLLTKSGAVALAKAQLLDEMNVSRRHEQDQIYRMALLQAEVYKDDPVLVVSHAEWNHGIVGIVAAKLLEAHKKPTFVLQEIGEESKGSARSYGDFSAADAIRACDDIITKGGGHRLAAGVTLPTANIDTFRRRVNEYFRSLDLRPQPPLLLPQAEVTIEILRDVDEGLVQQLADLEPFGNGNPEPIIKAVQVRVCQVKTMGAEGQHMKIRVADREDNEIELVAFNAPKEWEVQNHVHVDVWFSPTLNVWRNRRSVEGRLLHIVVRED